MIINVKAFLPSSLFTAIESPFSAGVGRGFVGPVLGAVAEVVVDPCERNHRAGLQAPEPVVTVRRIARQKLFRNANNFGKNWKKKLNWK